MRKHILFPIFLLFSAFTFAQVGPGTTIKLTQLEKSKTVESSKAGQIGLTNTAGQQRYAQYVEINPVAIGYTPTATGNTDNLSEFVIAPDAGIWYIDWQGNALEIAASGGGGDHDWYATPSYTAPGAITQHAWRSADATIGGRYQPSGSPELTLVDSSAFDASGGGRAGLFLEGTTKNTIGMKQASNGKWNAIDGSSGNMYFYTDSTSKGLFIFMEGYGQPNIPISHTPHFSINTSTREIQAYFFPNTRNDSGNPVNVLNTDANGKFRSDPVAEVVAAGGGIVWGDTVSVIATQNDLTALPDSAGNYINMNRPGIYDLGGSAEIQNTYLNMGSPASNRVFRIGELGGTNNFGTVWSRNAAGSVGEVETFISDAGRNIYFDLWFRGLESRIQRTITTPYGSVLRQSRSYPSVYGSWNTIFETQTDGDFKMHGGIVADVRENAYVLTTAHSEQGAELDMFLDRKSRDSKYPCSVVSIRNQDTLTNAGAVTKRQNYIANHFIPNGINSDSVVYSVVFGEYNNSFNILPIDHNLGGYNFFNNVPGSGKRFSIRQNKHNNLTSPNLFEWLGIGEFDGDTSSNKIRFYTKYVFPNSSPSTTNGVKQAILWTGNGSTATPAFETITGDGNGIYGPDDTLDANGHNVTVPEGGYLNFISSGGATDTDIAIRSVTNYNNDDGFTRHFVAVSPVDSFMVESYDGGTRLNHVGGSGLTVSTTENLLLVADQAILPLQTSAPGTPTQGGTWFNTATNEIQFRTSTINKVVATLENVIGNVVAFGSTATITTGVSENMWVVPASLNGKTLDAASIIVLDGTGTCTANLKRTVPGGSGSNLSSASFTAPGIQNQTSLGLTVSTGDVIRLDVSAATGTLTGLSASFTFK